VDKDGKISGAEVKGMLKLQLEREPTDAEVAAMMKEFDINQDGFISFEEYMTTMCGEGYCEDAPCGRKGPIKFLIPVDGSIVAVKAFHYACRLLQKDDVVILYHVTNPHKYKEMASSFHPDTIKNAFETEAIKADINMTHKMEFICEEKRDDGRKISQMIRDYADLNCDVVVLGSFGAKTFERKAKDDAEFKAIGSTTALVTNGCRANSIVISRKVQDLPLKNQRRFLVAVDSSEISHFAYKQACCFLRKGDYMQVVYIETPGNPSGAKLMSAYGQDLLASKIKGSCKVFKIDDKASGSTIGNKILDIAEGGELGDEFGCTDVCVLGSNGLSEELPPRTAASYKEYKDGKRDAHKKGSVAQHILDHARIAVMTLTVDCILDGPGQANIPPFKEWLEQYK